MNEKVVEKYLVMVEEQGDSLGRLLNFGSKKITELILEKYKSEKANIILSTSQYDIMQSLCLKGMKGTELASKLRISKQAVGQFINELETLGLVKRIADPKDSRAKIIKHTKKGYNVISSLLDLSMEVEESLMNKFGKKEFLTLKKILSEL